ncbi:MAG: hypothetical protein IJY58_01395 [Alphaproteobacteria bacterium]|nr:hypothetical protein [Alphaproteobacteria bacterium]
MFFKRLLNLFNKESKAEKEAREAQEAKEEYDSIMFTMAVSNEDYYLALKLLEETPALAHYGIVEAAQPLHQLANVLAQDTFNPEATQLYVSLCEAGMKPTPSDIHKLIQQKHNLPIICRLYETQPHLRNTIKNLNPLLILAKSLATENRSEQDVTLFGRFAQMGIPANKTTVKLLFRQPENLPIIRYLFMVQPELSPENPENDGQNYVRHANQSQNHAGLLFLYTLGVELSSRQIKTLGKSRLDSNTRLNRQFNVKRKQQQKENQ